MCGIFGAVFCENASSIDVATAIGTLSHRGPDATGVFRAPGMVLGHTRLAVIDLTPAGAQPMATADAEVVVTFNGEIYNHQELRRELQARGHSFRSRSDTEVIIEGYRAWGERVVEHLDGMFAFGLVDLARRRLLLARDRVGKKPLFYTRQAPGGGVRFASEVKAIIASGMPPEFDEKALPTLLALGYAHAPQTFHRGVEQLPPASLMVIEESGASYVRRYWQAPFAAEPLDCSVDEAAGEVRRLMRAAVQRRLEADVPVGAFLSGGVDSTIVVGLMAQLTPKKVKTFSIGFAKDARYDERHFAREAATAFGTEHTEFVVEPSSFDLVERLVDLHDGPFGDSSAIPTSIVSKLTRAHVTVALTGDGGDEIFCGYERFLAAEAAERIPSPVRALGRAFADRMPVRAGDRTLPARAHRFLSAASRPLTERLVAWTSYFGLDLDAFVRPEVASQSAWREVVAWNDDLASPAHAASPLARVLRQNFETYLPDDLLVKADRASMAHSLELRSPFLDTALIEFVARLPDHYKRRFSTTKWILRQAFPELLPASIKTRGKMGFGVPLGTWFRTDLRNHVQDRLGAGARIHEYVRADRVAKMLEEHMAGFADHGQRIWLLLTFELWLRRLAQPVPARKDAVAAVFESRGMTGE